MEKAFSTIDIIALPEGNTKGKDGIDLVYPWRYGRMSTLLFSNMRLSLFSDGVFPIKIVKDQFRRTDFVSLGC